MNQDQLNVALDNLSTGNSMLTKIRKVNGGKVQIEIAERIANPNTQSSGTSEVLQALNKSDERFSASKPRRGWVSGQPEDLSANIPQIAEAVATCSAGEVGTEVIVGLVNPKIANKRLCLQVVETVEGDDYEMLHIEEKAKRAGSNGDILRSNGLPIFSHTSVTTEGFQKHVFLQADAVGVSASVSGGYAAAAASV
jgi:hypothetical protein